ncbi:MAG: hypothetical protein ACAF42_02760 [Limnothrix sp. BL-A-16]
MQNTWPQSSRWFGAIAPLIFARAFAVLLASPSSEIHRNPTPDRVAKARPKLNWPQAVRSALALIE